MCILQVGGSVLDPDLPGPLNCGQSKSEGAVLVQLREFKTHLLEAVEELRACRVIIIASLWSRAKSLRMQSRHCNGKEVDLVTLGEASCHFWPCGQLKIDTHHVNTVVSETFWQLIKKYRKNLSSLQKLLLI